MKKLLLVFCSLLLAFLSMAQITITNSTTPTVGNVATEREDTTFSGISIGNSGTNQTWNFSNLENHVTKQTGFVTPSSLAGSSFFPTANIGMDIGDGNSQFGKTSSTGFEMLGIYGDVFDMGMIIPMEITPSIKIISYPAAYDVAYNGTYVIDERFPYPSAQTDSGRMVQNVTYTSLIDGWGTVTTPSQTGISALRQYYREIKTTAINVHLIVPVPMWVQYSSTTDTTYSYRWWGGSVNYPLAEIELVKSIIGHTDSITSAKFLHTYLPGTITGITGSNNHVNDVVVYPNPASSVIFISGINEISTMFVNDITGKLISGTALDKTKNSVNISDYENGIYFYNIVNLKGSVVSKGRFVVVK